MKELSARNAIAIHSVIPFSRVNGPGSRMVVFFQGCGHNCSGCFNPATHASHGGSRLTPEALLERYVKDGIDGMTVSGGEPFDQPHGLLGLLQTAQEKYGLPTIVYTGYSYEALGRCRERFDCLPYIDLLIDGKYDLSQREESLLARGSTNQRFYFLTDRYDDDDLLLPAKAEIRIGRDGEVTKTGFSRIEF